MKVARVPLAAILLGSVGCVTLQPVAEPAQFIPKANPQIVYVILRNHSQVVLTQPRVSGDTLIGALEGVSSPMAVPLSHVQRIEVVQRDKKRTTLADRRARRAHGYQRVCIRACRGNSRARARGPPGLSSLAGQSLSLFLALVLP